MAEANKPIPEHEIADHLENEETHPDVLHKIALQQPGHDEYSSIANHKNAAPATLKHIHDTYKDVAGDDNDGTVHAFQKEVAQHPNAPGEIVQPHFDAVTPDSYRTEGYDHTDHNFLTHPNIDPKLKADKVKALTNDISHEPVEYSSRKGDREGYSKYNAQKRLLEDWLHSPDTHQDHLREFAKHPNPDVAKHAASAPHADKDIQEAFVNNANTDHYATQSFLHHSEEAHPDVVRAAYNRFKDADLTPKHEYETPIGLKEDFLSAVAKHKNTPSEIIREIADRPVPEGADDYHDGRSRYHALVHPTIPKERVHDLAQDGDQDAMHAAIDRPDTSSETMRAIDSAMGKASGRRWSNRANDLIKHPNYPEDLQLQRVKNSVADAKGVLQRKHIPENVLKTLVNHKNQDLAISALKHDSVTPEVVKEAYKRKAGDVSRAAAAHPLAPAELQLEKVKADPIAASALARSHNDPEFLHQISDLHPHDRSVQVSLIRNPNTPTKTLTRIAAGLDPDRLAFDTGYHDELDIKTLAKHPNITRGTRETLMRYAPRHVMENPNITSEEIHKGLEHWKKSDANDQETQLNGLTSMAATHPALTEEMAKNLIGGTYGKVDLGYRGYEKLHDHPAYTKEVIQHGLNAPAEMVETDLINHLARSSYLTTKDIQQHIDGMNWDSNRNDQMVKQHEMMKSFLRHENAPMSEVEKALKGTAKWGTNDELQTSAIKNPNVAPKHLKEMYAEEDATHGDGAHEALVQRIRDHGLQQDALKNSKNLGVVASVMRGGRYGDLRYTNPEHLKAALENPHLAQKVVQQLVPDMFGHEYVGRGRNRTKQQADNPTIREVMDSLATHPNAGLKAAAFQWMSGEGQLKAGQLDINDEKVIQGLRPDAVSKIKINSEMPADAVQQILHHKGRVPEHLEQAALHSPEGAKMALQKTHLGDPKKDTFESEFKEKIEQIALENHGHDQGVARMIAEHTKSAKSLGTMMSDPEKYGRYFDMLAENPKIKADDLAKLTSYSGPEYFDAFHAAVKSKKANADLLHHASKHYPELLSQIAAHPKVATAKVLKQVLAGANEHESVPTKVALVNNEKVPQGIKDELLKDPKVLFGARSEHVTPEHLEQYATHENDGVLEHVANHPNVSTETLDKLVNHALLKASSDDENYMSDPMHGPLSSAASSGKLSPEAIDKLSHKPNYAMHILKNQRGLSPEQEKKIIDRHTKDGKIHEDVLEAAFNNYHTIHSSTIDHLIEHVDLDHEDIDGDRPAVHFANILESNDAAKPEHFERLLNKIAEKRNGEFKYTEKDSQRHIKAESRLLSGIAFAGPDSTLKKIAHIPELHGQIIGNDNASTETLDKIAKTITPKRIEDMDNSDLEKLAEHPNLSQESANSLLKKAVQEFTSSDDYRNTNRFARKLMQNPLIEPKTLSTLWEKNRMSEALSNPNMPISTLEKALDFHVVGNGGQKRVESLKHIAKNPNFKVSMLDKVKPEDIDSASLNTLFDQALSNPRMTGEDIATMYKHLKKGHIDSDTAKKFVKHASTPESVVKQMIDNGKISKEDAYYSPAVGGKLWRAEKHPFPANTGILQRGKEIHEATFRPREEKVKKVMSMIPHGGFLDWAEFKKSNPSLAGDPLVQKMFTSAPKTRVDQAHAEKYLNEMPSKKFHLSYQRWTGMQRHNKNPQLVVNVNNHEEQENALRKDPKLHALYSMIQDASRYSSHPVNPQSIGWSRVDTSNKDHWFVDEIQSDFGSQLSSEMDEINKRGEAARLQEKYGMTPEEGKKAVNDMMGAIHGWEKGLLSSIIEMAKAHGVKKVSIHSGKSKTYTNKGENAEVTRKYGKIYDALPQEMGFQASKYDSIPGAGTELKGQDVWTYEIPEEAKAPKRGLPKAG